MELDFYVESSVFSKVTSPLQVYTIGDEQGVGIHPEDELCTFLQELQNLGFS